MLVARVDIDGLRLLDHLKVGGNLVKCNFLDEGALVVHVDFEGVLVVLAMMVFVMMLSASFDGWLVEDGELG